MQKYQGEIMLFFVSLLAAFGWFASKYAIAELPPSGFLGIRFLAASILFLPFSYRQLRQLTRAQFIRAIAVGSAFSANIFLWVQAVSHSTQFGEGAFLMSMSMLFAPLLSWLVFRNRPMRSFWLSLMVAIAGLVFLNAGRPLAQFSLSSFLYAGASLAGALFFVLNNQYAKDLPTLALATLQLATAGVVCAVYSGVFETWQNSVSLHTWAWVAISVILVTNFRYFLQTWGQKLCPIGNAAIIMVLEPVWTLLLSVLLFGEIMTWQKMTGGCLILLALILYRLPLQFVGKCWRQK
ncbi:DMT family transporter [Neisseriaceae bacterium B1]